MNKRKRDDEESGSSNAAGGSTRRLFVPDYVVKKSSHYFPPPASMDLTPSASSATTWFSFASRKDYYPIAIKDDDLDRHVTEPSLVVNLTVSLKHSKARPPYEISARHNHGIYWFQAVQMHITGTLVLTFTCSDESVEPLIYEIPVRKVEEDSEDEQAEAEVEAKREEVVEDDDDEIIHEPKKSSKKAQVKSEKKSSVVSEAPVLSTFAYSEEVALADRKAVAKEYFSSVQQPPLVELVLPKNRLENNFLSSSYISSGLFNPSNSNVFTVEGRAMSIKIPPCLLNAFYYDRTVISPMMLLTSSEETSSKKSRSSSRVESTEPEHLKKTMAPSAHELFEEVERRASHVQNYKASIEILRYLFENLLEGSLLFDGERDFFHKRIASCEEEKKLLALEFGPYFFLRFVLCVVHLATPQKDNSFGASNRIKGPLFDAERVLEVAVKLLEENATRYFF